MPAWPVRPDSWGSWPWVKACWSGTARWFARNRARWKGTLVFIGQPAEEKGGGAAAMLKDGLFQKFPKPDACVALHCGNELALGTFGMTEGPATANVDTVDITVRGIGGHGSPVSGWVGW